MSSIDLTEKNIVYHKWEMDTITGVLNIVFLIPNPIPMDPDIEVGRILIEPERARSLVESMRNIGRTLYPDADMAQLAQHRTHYDNRTETAKTEFYEVV
jgi:hypothetical protein